MNQFIQRVANYVANEIFVKGLANSKTFQKFAVRTDSHLSEMKKGGVESLNSKLDDLHKAATEAAYSTAEAAKNSSSKSSYHTSGPPTPPKGGFPGFVSAFGKEVKKDLGIGK
ncbi:hypothetical protein CTEN210_07911 [Chaetoceros tenuissimus]|uniref:Uncharacterized protein n=1 Tax=Chaetoceros tenuissimus TaxID=426638 RepID=A0AAD3CV18_9STRA|nr:hypothetical protein CTEN210_07911 [Chaetoceros tenuissimus]